MKRARVIPLFKSGLTSFYRKSEGTELCGIEQ